MMDSAIWRAIYQVPVEISEMDCQAQRTGRTLSGFAA